MHEAPRPPRLAELIAIALAALLLRAAVFFSAAAAFDIPLDAYAAKGDGGSYLACAAAMNGDVPLAEVDAYHRRVFPGYPALIALVHLAGVPRELGALLITWTSAGLAAALAGALFADRRLGYATALLVPHYLINSSLAMSEAPMLALALGGMLAAGAESSRLLRHAGRAGGIILSGALLGFACLVRPMAAFALLCAIALAWRRRGRAAGIGVASVAAVVVLGGTAILHAWTGDALAGARIYRDHPGAYAGRIFAPPLSALLAWPMQHEIAPGRLAYIWIHAAVALGATGILITRALAGGKAAPNGGRDLDFACAIWLAGNTLFVLCVAPPWGFEHFPRLLIPAGPPLFWALRALLPRSLAFWIVLAAGLFVFAVLGVKASP